MKALAAFLLASLPLAGESSTLLVANKREATLTFVDLETGIVRAAIPTGLDPHEVEVSADGRWAVVSMYGTDEKPGSTITVVDVPAGKETRTVALEGFTRPHGIRWLSDNRHAWITAEFERSLLKVDTSTGRIVERVDTGQEGSHMLALSSDGKLLFTSNRGSNSVSVFDASTGRKLRDLPAGPAAEGIDLSPDGREIWTGFRASNEVGVIDIESGSVVSVLSTGRAPFRTRLTPDGRLALVSNLESSNLSVFDVAARKLVKTIALPLMTLGPFEQPDPLGSYPSGILVEPRSKRIYVAHTRAREVSIIDLETLERIGVLVVGYGADGLAYSGL
jgi:DNA-binding beta-propeller fold protein YncE